MTPSEKIQKVVERVRLAIGEEDLTTLYGSYEFYDTAYELLPKLAKALERVVKAILREDPDDAEGYLQEIAEILEGE